MRGIELRKFRRQKRVSIDQVREKLGFNGGTLNDIENEILTADEGTQTRIIAAIEEIVRERAGEPQPA